MKKLFLLLSIICISTLCSGCTRYFKAETGTSGDVYYGVFKERNITMADVVMYKHNGRTSCDGVIFLDHQTRRLNPSNKKAPAKMVLACNDNSLIDATWMIRKAEFNNGTAEGVDQYNNKYTFKTIKRKEFKMNMRRKVKFFDEYTEDLNLKY